MSNNKLRVLMADDHQLVRAGLRALLDAIPDVEVVAEVGNGMDAVRLTIELVPDVALLDIAMPVLGGLPALHRIQAAGVATRVVLLSMYDNDEYVTQAVLLSMYDNDEYVTQAVRAGAAGYIVKDAAVEELALALQAVRRGDTYLSPAISRKLAQAFAAGSQTQAAAALTPRQTNILRLVARGHSSKEIARELELSIKTVETHRAQIMERLDVRDLAGLVRYAVRTGLVAADE